MIHFWLTFLLADAAIGGAMLIAFAVMVSVSEYFSK